MNDYAVCGLHEMVIATGRALPNTPGHRRLARAGAHVAIVVAAMSTAAPAAESAEQHQAPPREDTPEAAQWDTAGHVGFAAVGLGVVGMVAGVVRRHRDGASASSEQTRAYSTSQR